MINNCPECQLPVSSTAPACPHCGAPNPAAVDGTAVTTQKTGKELKRFFLLSYILIFSGCTTLFSGPTDSTIREAAVSMLIGGLVMWVGLKIASWWRHG